LLKISKPRKLPCEVHPKGCNAGRGRSPNTRGVDQETSSIAILGSEQVAYATNPKNSSGKELSVAHKN